MADPGPAGDGGARRRRAASPPRCREVTASALLFGVILGAVLNASITYAGLKIGFTIGGSAIAAILGFGVLRGLLRKGSILETNIAQTVASAVNVSSGGMIFTVPVLYLLGLDFHVGLMAAACVAGAVLGCTFIIPLRKQMIDIERLRFPSATAVAAILKSPGAGAKKFLVLAAGSAAAAVIYLPTQLPALGLPGYGALGWAPLGDEALDLGRLFGLPDQLQLLFAIAPFALGAGYLTGRGGLVVLAGGLLAHFVVIPAAYGWGWMPAALEAAGAVSWA